MHSSSNRTVDGWTVVETKRPQNQTYISYTVNGTTRRMAVEKDGTHFKINLNVHGSPFKIPIELKNGIIHPVFPKRQRAPFHVLKPGQTSVPTIPFMPLNEYKTEKHQNKWQTFNGEQKDRTNPYTTGTVSIGVFTQWIQSIPFSLRTGEENWMHVKDVAKHHRNYEQSWRNAITTELAEYYALNVYWCRKLGLKTFQSFLLPVDTSYDTCRKADNEVLCLSGKHPIETKNHCNPWEGFMFQKQYEKSNGQYWMNPSIDPLVKRFKNEIVTGTYIQETSSDRIVHFRMLTTLQDARWSEPRKRELRDVKMVLHPKDHTFSAPQISMKCPKNPSEYIPINCYKS